MGKFITIWCPILAAAIAARVVETYAWPYYREMFQWSLLGIGVAASIWAIKKSEGSIISILIAAIILSFGNTWVLFRLLFFAAYSGGGFGG